MAFVASAAMAQGDGDADEAPHALSVPLQALLQAVQDSLADARQYNGQRPYFLVKRIKLELSVTRRTSAEGGIEFEVPVLPLEVEIDGDMDDEVTESVSMTLQPAPQTLVGAAEKINLAELMQAVKTALPAQADSGGLSLTELTYATRFYLQIAAGGGIKFALLKVGADVSKASSQRVEFELCQTIDLLDCVE